MKTKHTPGPWSVTERKQEIRGNAWRLVLEIDGPYTEPVTNLYGAESRANARLIAAAPTLLETLEVCIAMLDPKRDADAIVIKAMKNAIAKAKGDL